MGRHLLLAAVMLALPRWLSLLAGGTPHTVVASPRAVARPALIRP
jgi:hypothetical protein